MHWVYVIKSSTTGNVYVGETTRLFRRWNEHITGRGGKNTSKDNYDTLIGLYNVGNNTSFLENKNDLIDGNYTWKSWFYWGTDECKQNACMVENLITERYFFEKMGNVYCGMKISGGKYTNEKIIDKFVCNETSNNVLIDRPLCKCGYPCEVNMKNDKTKIYFNCPLTKPTNWNDNGFFRGLNLPHKCNFYQEFEPYRISKQKYEIYRSERCKKQAEWWVERLPTEKDECIECGKDDFEPFWNPNNEFYSVCEECFHIHYDKLKEEYRNKVRDLSHIFPDCE